MPPSNPYVLSNGMNADEVCMACKAGWHVQCSKAFDEFGVEAFCCCEGTYSAVQQQLEFIREALDQDLEGDADGLPAAQAAVAKAQKPQGNSGYIHPDAWRSEKNIGELTDPQSTGRKRAKDMYPIPQGLMCEWAGLQFAGGGVTPIVGCVGYPAQDIHHGPDKNPLNNAKVSMGIGTLENIHRICSWCHNTWHAENDPFYPRGGHKEESERNYERDQATPFVPQDPKLEIHAHDGITKAEHPRVYDLTTKGRVGKDVVGEVEDDDE